MTSHARVDGITFDPTPQSSQIKQPYNHSLSLLKHSTKSEDQRKKIRSWGWGVGGGVVYPASSERNFSNQKTAEVTYKPTPEQTHSNSESKDENYNQILLPEQYIA